MRKGIEDLRAEAGRMHASGARLSKMAWEAITKLESHKDTCLVCGGLK